MPLSSAKVLERAKCHFV